MFRGNRGGNRETQQILLYPRKPLQFALHYMLSNITNIDFADMSEAIPCYICIIAMPFFYSISEGIALGIIAYVVLNLVTGKAKEKKLNLLLYILAIIFIIKECSSLFF